MIAQLEQGIYIVVPAILIKKSDHPLENITITYGFAYVFSRVDCSVHRLFLSNQEQICLFMETRLSRSSKNRHTTSLASNVEFTFKISADEEILCNPF